MLTSEANPPVPISPSGSFMASPLPAALPTHPPPRDPVWSGWDVLLIAVLTIVSVISLGAMLGLGTYLYQQKSLKEVAQALAYIAVGAFMVMMVKESIAYPSGRRFDGTGRGEVSGFWAWGY